MCNIVHNILYVYSTTYWIILYWYYTITKDTIQHAPNWIYNTINIYIQIMFRILKNNNIPCILHTFKTFLFRIGRKPAFLLALSMFVTSGSVAAFMPNYYTHIFTRLITASSGAGFFTIAFVIREFFVGHEFWIVT